MTLRISTDHYTLSTESSSSQSPLSSVGPHDDDVDSLFDEVEDTMEMDLEGGIDELASCIEPPTPTGINPASRTGPDIPGLYFNSHASLPDGFAEELLEKCISTYFQNGKTNQIMLFERVQSGEVCSSDDSKGSGLPPFLKQTLQVLSECLQYLPVETHQLLFPPSGAPPQARQVILNHYRPGEGITPHVDLLDRFGDGIIGVSLGSGCVMDFAQHTANMRLEKDGPNGNIKHSVFLPHGSIYVMSKDARYGWTHGIKGRKEDWVQVRIGTECGIWVMRSTRVSITFRWLLPGADVVGGLADPASTY